MALICLVYPCPHEVLVVLERRVPDARCMMHDGDGAAACVCGIEEATMSDNMFILDSILSR